MGKEANNEKENIFITWHYTTHGIAYLKHILSAFYNNTVTVDKPNTENISQDEMNVVFEKETTGFLFNKIYYLTAAQKTFDNISARRFNYWQQIVEKDELVKNSKALKVWEDLQKEYTKISDDKPDLYDRFDNIDIVIDYVRNKYPEDLFEEWKSQIWRNIQHFKIKDQILWFRKYSNAHRNYKDSEIFIEKNIDGLNDLRNPLQIYQEIMPFINEVKEKHPDANIIINAVLGSNETQVVWHILSELDILPKETKLIRTYDNKNHNPEELFKDFNIQEIPNKIVSKIKEITIYPEKPITKSADIAEQKFQHYINEGFAILLIGDRGIGKSHMAEKNKENKEVVVVNCASFSSDELAASQLFGHVAAAFTGANVDKKGFFHEAENKILFLDEIHHLSKNIQSQLFRAIQTDKDNNFTIRRVGSEKEEKIKTTLVFATNISIKKLRKKLLPDFYDRIVQLVIEMPSLKDSKKDLDKLFESIWGKENLNFSNYPNDKELIKWIKTLELKGNFRDLQRIAIFYKSYLDFDDKLKKNISEKSAFEFTKNQYEKYIAIDIDDDSLLAKLFSDNLNEVDLVNLYRREFASYFIDRYNNSKEASEHFRDLKGKIAPETLLRWRSAKLSNEKQ